MIAAAAGVWSAWRAPALIDRRLVELTSSPDVVASAGPERADAGTALRAAGFALRVLSRLPGRRWRTTCLYRSVAECAALRAIGCDARVAIAVTSLAGGGDPRGDAAVAAHAWVEDSRGRVRGSAAAAHEFHRLREAC